MSAHNTDACAEPLPGESLRSSHMPGHWLLARLGKRVLRPGGIESTRQLLDALAIGHDDDVVEFAPGLGVTARLTLAKRPRSYQAVERDEDAAAHMARLLRGHAAVCHAASAEATGLPDGCATAVYGEAMLSMQTPQQKARIVAEAARLLRAGGRYGIHELSLRPDDLPQSVKDAILAEMTAAIHVGVRPLTTSEWKDLLEQHGLAVEVVRQAPFHLLEPRRIVQDEGITGALRFVSRVLRDHQARRRVLRMRRTFRTYREHLSAIVIVACKA